MASPISHSATPLIILTRPTWSWGDLGHARAGPEFVSQESVRVLSVNCRQQTPTQANSGGLRLGVSLGCVGTQGSIRRSAQSKRRAHLDETESKQEDDAEEEQHVVPPGMSEHALIIRQRRTNR